MIFSYNLSNSGSEKQFKDESNSLEKKVLDLKDYIAKSDSSIKLWNEEIKLKHSERPGLKVEEFKKLLDQLKEIYKIQSLTINLLTPEQRVDLGALKYITVRSSNLNLSFEALTDVDVYQFLVALVSQTPGYLQVKNISITGISEVNNEVAKTLVTSGSKSIVTVKVEFVWQDLQDLNTPPTETTEKAK